MRFRKRHAAMAVVAAVAAGSGYAVTRHTPAPTEVASPAQVRQGTCGVERWSVKTGTDPAAATVSLSPQSSTIASLVSLRAPVSPSVRGSGETLTFTVHATLTGYKREADHDEHLVISDGTHTMIAEIPDPSCAIGSRWSPQLATVRSAFEARYPLSTSFAKLHQPVTVTGVAFFDKIHGQTGVAPNGVELHPLLAITFN